MRPSSPLAVLIFGLAAAGCSNASGSPRGGPGGDDPDSAISQSAPAKKCGGQAQQCWEMLDDACGNVRGCRLDGVCTGLANDCIFQHGEDCGGQKGCKRNADDDQCIGVSTACSKLNTIGECDNQDGCSWEHVCEGDAGTCDELTADDCEAQLGCRLVN